ncbi:MAG: hypothetical protein ACNA77_00515 [Opitutales bacterium]
MSGWTKAHQSIRDELVGKVGTRVLVVEGEDDKAFITSLLDKRNPGEWTKQWAIGVAEGKQNLLRILTEEPTWRGVVDRDEWSDAAAAKAKLLHSSLFVLPRFCMENYFIEPGELWAALPPEQQARIGVGEANLKTALAANLAAWLRHGALWHAVNPLWDGLRAIGFKDKLLKLETAQDDAKIRNTLKGWHDHLEPSAIFAEFQENLTTAHSARPELQYRKWIHGKRFFSQEVVPVLNQYLGQAKTDQWMINLRQSLPLPTDLEPLWTEMGL